ncbi:casein kinase 2 regulatory subunit [Coelomomyces lativittatus]|nr:casein kinase 2 regulatory subunit [Coelomomyces lativittatus]KAJ1505787.1 casein kinase 2 regulatory subunit [Coelomomyces lativittatus]KAJ1518240.1 casein kinase 2 regulatory subunit [Coelomomyces lativittatus]
MSENLYSTSDSTSSFNQRHWIDEFLSKKGNEYFCDVDEEYITDKFNLTGLPEQVVWFPATIDIITNRLDYKQRVNVQTRESLSASACHLYGLIHARFILSAKGLQKMAEKVRHCSFGCCPRVLCNGSPIIPIGLHDEPGISSVKLYCYLCQDVYNPPKPSSRRPILDGAYWGTTYAHFLIQLYPNLIHVPTHLEMYMPKVFGFALHEQNNLQKKRRWMKSQLHQLHAQPFPTQPSSPTCAMNSPKLSTSTLTNSIQQQQQEEKDEDSDEEVEYSLEPQLN